MQQYLNVLARIMAEGIDNPKDRTGHGRKRIFGVLERFDISNGKLPVVTTRSIKTENGIRELLMFIYGITNINYLKDAGVNIWNKWAVTNKTPITMLEKFIALGYSTPKEAQLASMNFDPRVEGEIGPMYGSMWRFWPKIEIEIPRASVIRTIEEMPSDQVEALTKSYNDLSDEQKAETSLKEWLVGHYYAVVDQLNELVCNLKSDPYGSRHVVSAYNPEFNPINGYTPDENVLLGRNALMACHIGFEIFVKPPKEPNGKDRLSLKFNMRSADVPVGVPTNLVCYGVLAHLLAHVCGMETDELLWSAADAHIYLDQIEGVEEQLTRSPFEAPTITINPELTDLFKVKFEDITINNYVCDKPIIYPVAI